MGASPRDDTLRPAKAATACLPLPENPRHSREGGNPNPRLPLQATTREEPAGCRKENTLRPHHGWQALRHPVQRGFGFPLSRE